MKIGRLFENPYRVFSALACRGVFTWMADRMYLKLMFRSQINAPLNLKSPQSFNEKLQWLKLNNRNTEYTVMVDKYRVKDYVSRIIGKEYIIPTLGAWKDPEEIDFNRLPEQFVLKCNHNSGLGMYICTEKSKMDINEVKRRLRKGLAQDYYLTNREWPYKDVPRRIIAEQYITDNPKDYKFFCFNGVPKITLVCSERFTAGGLKEDFFDENWNHLDMRRPKHGNSTEMIEKPVNHELMMELAAKISKDIPFVRIDFYEVDGKVYFGEITFYPASGFEKFEPEEWDYKLGQWIELPEKK